MKENLLRRELILDADDRPALENELKNMRVDYTIGKHIMIPSSSISAQSIIGGLKTNLTFLTTREPSLEDAYIKLLAHKEGDAA
jgi:ABC-2 type transport system ATP-binding protein